MNKILILTIILTTFFNVSPCFATETGVESFALDATEKGWRYFNHGDLETALKRFHQAAILDPNFAPAYYGKAYVYSFQNRLKLAIDNYRKAIDLAEQPYTSAYGNLGLALLISGEEQEGFQLVQKALEIDPNNGEAHNTLANYYCSKKNSTLAWKHLEQAKENGVQPDPQLIVEMKKECPNNPINPTE